MLLNRPTAAAVAVAIDRAAAPMDWRVCTLFIIALVTCWVWQAGCGWPMSEKVPVQLQSVVDRRSAECRVVVLARRLLSMLTPQDIRGPLWRLLHL